MKYVLILLLIPIFAFSNSNYAKCAACHGRTAEKDSIGTDHALKSHTRMELLETLKYYRDKQPSKSVLNRAMSKRMFNKSDKDLNELVDTIMNFKAKDKTIEEDCSFQILD